MRRAARKDLNHGDIVKAFKLMGCSVQDLSNVGGGCPDLLVGINGLNILVEVKSGKNELRDNQEKWANSWNGQTTVVNQIQEAVDLVNKIRTQLQNL